MQGTVMVKAWSRHGVKWYTGMQVMVIVKAWSRYDQDMGKAWGKMVHW